MAYNDDQNESPVPTSNNEKRNSASLLPRYFRTSVNKKFLEATLDQVTRPGVAEKINGYFGRKHSKAFLADDNYIGDTSKQREDYQLEPATIIKNDIGNVVLYKDYNDYINQIKNFGGNVENQNFLNSQEYYAWNPNVNWDMFVNFREYYWLPNGPQAVQIFGQSKAVESTYTITLETNIDNEAYVFSPDGLTQTPTIILYRGQTYKFEIDAPDMPFNIRTSKTLDAGFNYEDGISEQGVAQGTITFTVPEGAPDVLYYVSSEDINNSGMIQILDIEENTKIDVEKEILGKKNYTTERGFPLSNGMKLEFIGEVTPEKYSKGQWYVEGVGERIQLVSEDDLEIPSTYNEDLEIPFDTQAFDRLPFDNAAGYTATKDYIVVNRASPDRNAWSRGNRWFHKTVIENSAEYNSQPISVDQTARATRPIIEFNAGLHLFQYGTEGKSNVDLIDTFTTDIFSTIEGSLGYNIDGIDLVDGMRVLFTAEQDIREAGKIFKVRFINHNGKRQITLVEEPDSVPKLNEVVLALNGQAYQGRLFYFNGASWNLTQEKTKVNQAPLFDLFDDNGSSYGDLNEYPGSTFRGNKVFSYRIGSGTVDTELGFPLSYRSISNVGDIVYDFNLVADEFEYVVAAQPITVSTSNCVLHQHTSRENFKSVNGWIKAKGNSRQDVIRQYIANEGQTDFNIDVYNNSHLINDIKVKLFQNNNLLFEGVDFEIVNKVSTKVVRLNSSANENDIILIKTQSSASKNQNGLYEIPSNYERNPLNNEINDFTLGEVNEHVESIVSEVDGFSGAYPGVSNLRDLGNVGIYGKKFLQHSGPINLALYHLTDKDNNIIKAIDYSRREYAKFKRLFLQTAYSTGFDGSPKEHVDIILREMNSDKNITMPFYFSDMAPVTGAKRITYTVFDPENEFYALSRTFNEDAIDVKAVGVYINDTQLIIDKDYTFNNEGFCQITTTKNLNDRIDIYEYETTDGNYIPPTPTKLGLYPKYIPEITVDDTYLEPKKIIIGHDGSKIIAYDDYRDDLILEIERRIYNNLKLDYDTSIFDIHEFIEGEYRDSDRIPRSNLDTAMIKDFASWLNVIGNEDYTSFAFYQRANTFTYNYSSMSSPDGKPLPGFWRAVYKNAYDTDHPHTHPWEMLGFSIKPDWWEDQYGPAPYTSNNLILWQDIEKGKIRQPGRPIRTLSQYARPGLTNHLPVNDQGELLSPLDSNYAKNYVNSLTRKAFVFGDEAPVETAWRRSSEYPFALIKSFILNKPAKTIGLAFDRLRTVRNSAGQLVYSETGRRIKTSDLIFPNDAGNVQRIFTLGLVNFIANYLASNVLTNFSNYKERLTRLENQIAFKLGGFTDKSKLNLILDSRTPLNEGNVFVPEENYRVILTTSSPIDVANYSGVVVEKSASGWIIRGYDSTDPVFRYYQYNERSSDTNITVGGVSESFTEWNENKQYVQGKVVKYNDRYYRTLETHTSTSTFDGTKFVVLPELPNDGGRSALIRTSFDKSSVQILPYGTQLRTSQEVVDFLIGYGEYLEDLGFIFENYNSDIASVENWKLSAKEFLFWASQNWDSGTLISLSPAAQNIRFYRDNTMVDNIFDSFYEYSVLKADGTQIREDFLNIVRQDENGFDLTLKNTADGIYAIKLPLVQKEHTVVLDSKTAFKDVIYEPETGYRQERIRVLGYRTADWKGTLNIPGFLYDDAIVYDWEQWKDYAIGDIVKNKEFYYTAINKVTGSETFDPNKWYRLNEKPEPGLKPNLEYKVNQFADFYDLDTDNFDVEQQRIAQHLIGYQKRQYLSNIVNDDVSQYKFYQGMIADKGTKNALSKLFDSLSSANKDSIEFYEEWAVKLGQYGAADGFEEVEFKLSEDKFLISPQPVLLTNEVPDVPTDLVYRLTEDEVYLKTKDYTHAPFPTKYVEENPVKTAGYVRADDVQWTILQKADILNIPIEEIEQGEYVWATFDSEDWNVYKHIDSGLKVTSAQVGGGTSATIFFDRISSFVEGDIIGIQDVPGFNGFYEVVTSVLNRVTINLGENIPDSVDEANGIVSKFTSNRVKTLSDANLYAQQDVDDGEIIWVDDNGSGKWNVIKSNKSYALNETINNPTTTATFYGQSLSASADNKILAIGAPEDGDGKVYVYQRTSENENLEPLVTLEPIDNYASSNSRYGQSVAVSQDGNYIAVSAPFASNVKSAFKDEFDITANYNNAAIVSYAENLWQSRRSVKGQVDNVSFNSFDLISKIEDNLFDTYGSYSNIPTLITGDYPLGIEQENPNFDINQDVSDSNPVTIPFVTDHVLVRAPDDMYDGSKPGDYVYFEHSEITNNLRPINKIPIKNIFETSVDDTDRIHVTFDSFVRVVNQVFKLNPVRIESESHEFENGQRIIIAGAVGLVDINNEYYIRVINADEFELYSDIDLTQTVNGTAWAGTYQENSARAFSAFSGQLEINLATGDEILLTEIPNNGFLETSATQFDANGNPLVIPSFDNSNPDIALNVKENFGIAGLQNQRFYVKAVANDTVELYRDAALTIPVDASVGLLGSSAPGDFAGFISKIEKPFNNAYANITNTFLEAGPHEIRRKVDEVFYIENPLAIPEVGDVVTTDTGNATVVKVRIESAKMVLYVNNKNGIFANNDQLKIDNVFLIGNYARPLADTIERSQSLGGYWEIETNGTYVVDDPQVDTYRGLVYQDLTLDTATATPLPTSNSLLLQQNNPPFQIAGTTAFQKETSMMRVLSYVGNAGLGDILPVDQLDNRWVVRLDKAVSDVASQKLENGEEVKLGLWLNKARQLDADGNPLDIDTKIRFIRDRVEWDLSDTGLSFDIVNKTHTISDPDDLWDGWLDIRLTRTDIEFEVGDLVQEAENGARARVMHYQRDNLSARLWIKIIDGTFTFGRRYGETDFLSTIKKIFPNGNEVELGSLQARQLADGDIGKVAVFYEQDNFAIPDQVDYDVNVFTPIDTASFKTKFVTNIEWQSWIEETRLGISRSPLYPSDQNNDWVQVNNIPIDNTKDASSFTNEGAYFVYEYNEFNNTFNLVNGFILPNRENERKLGSVIKLAQTPDYTRLLINSDESHADDRGNISPESRGRLHQVLYGNVNNISYNWTLAKDPNYKGSYSQNSLYSANDVVEYNGTWYRAKINMQDGPFNPNKWSEIGDHIDFVGYLPNTSGYNFAGETAINPVLVVNQDQDNPLIGFASNFDTSENGKTIASVVEYDSTIKIAVYRLDEFHHSLYQVIEQPEDAPGFGSQVAVSDDGKLIAVSAPDADSNSKFQGKVFIYLLGSNGYQLTQTLTSENAEPVENFGFRIGFDGDQLAVTSANGDIRLDTTFDGNNTFLDNGFTNFVRRVIDSGVVYLYERINDTLVYGQQISYRDFDVYGFGKNLLIKQNHVYVGLTNYGDANGQIINFRKTPGDNSWVVHREPTDQVNINKFKGCFLYNTKSSELIRYLDIVDPVANKLIGVAEQELTYKTYYDPATYNVSEEAFVDLFNTWGKDQVGQLWWDLSRAKFLNAYQGDINYSQFAWNRLAFGASIDVYEWVETTVLPSEWDNLSGTNEGARRNITGTSLYGDRLYVQNQTYDKVAQRFITRYYYWVRRTTKVPNVENRKKSADEVASLIENPNSKLVPFVSLAGNDKFILHNVKKDISDNDVALNFRYWTIDNQDQNIHNEYQIISEGLSTSKPKRDIELKWFDSLCEQDKFGRIVPDSTLSDKQKYGSLFTPRQSWFKNPVEARKEYFERVNRVLNQTLLLDNFNIDSLLDFDPQPTDISRHYDVSVDTEDELRFIGTVRAETAQLVPVIQDGKIVSVTVENPGRGYKDITFDVNVSSKRKGPTLIINGTGSEAIIETYINNLGQIIETEVLAQGNYYDANTTITVRPLSALVRADSTIDGKWAIYTYDATTREWTQGQRQSYDVRDYWNYSDWYAEGYSTLTNIDFLIDEPYQLNIIDDNIGDIVKVENSGSGGWVLYRKNVNKDTPQYTENYEVVGRQDGTIQFTNSCITGTNNAVELRKIFEAIRDNLFVDELEIEYNNLFFAQLRYVLSEQKYVDWLFKTSFVKAKHNVGELTQRVTFQNDNLPSYEEYIREVKPYKTNIREYLSSYEKQENTGSVVTDFDLTPVYNEATGIIEPKSIKVDENVLTNLPESITEYPERHWLDNAALQVIRIDIEDGGTGYTEVPVITIRGGGGQDATAKAFLGQGSIKKIEITNPGTGYFGIPTIEVEGTQVEGSIPAKISLVMGNEKTRSIKVTQRFDRVSGQYETTNLIETETFTASGSQLKYYLKWPLNITKNKTKITIDGQEPLSSEYSVGNEDDKTKSYKRQIGYVLFVNTPPKDSTIVIEYNRNMDLLNAQDRINLLYESNEGLLGKDLSQLMDGIDYGGVQVKSFEFGQNLGWDNAGWYTDSWDSYDESYEDIVFAYDGSTTVFQLEQALDDNTDYNVYVNGVRIDDPNYDGSTRTYVDPTSGETLALANPNAIMPTLTTSSEFYDAENLTIKFENVVELESLYKDQSKIIIRKSTSDGSFLPEGIGLDTVLQGGNLAYGTATGYAPEDITVDGDGFVTPTTSKGPEELVPGQLLDVLDIKVVDRPADGGSLISVRNYQADQGQTVFDLSILPHSSEACFVKVNGTIVKNYEVNYEEGFLTFDSGLNAGDSVNIFSMGVNGENLLDIDNFVGDGVTQIFVSNVLYPKTATTVDGEEFLEKQDVSVFVTIDGNPVEVNIFEADESYGDNKGVIAFKFVIAPEENAKIQYAIYQSAEQSFSQATVDQFTADGSTAAYTLAQSPFDSLPLTHNIIVKVGNKILTPDYNEEFIVQPGIRNFTLDLGQIPYSSVSPENVLVFKNGTKLSFLDEFSWDFANTTVSLFDNVGDIGDTIEIFVLGTGEYRFDTNTRISLTSLDGRFQEGEDVTFTSGSSTYTYVIKSFANNILEIKGTAQEVIDLFNNGNTVTIEGIISEATAQISGTGLIEGGDIVILENVPLQNETIEIFTFSKHDIQGIERQVKTVTSRITTQAGSRDYYNYHLLTRGIVSLRKPALSVDYVWVTLNGTLLDANVDYTLSRFNDKVEIKISVTADDIIEVIHFAAQKTNSKFGYRIFKDMLNRTHYKRLNSDKVFQLASNLHYNDDTIELVDASGIGTPSKEINSPGVLFIDGERIEYFTVNGNTLGQLRRGTLGTGTKNVYAAGTEVEDQGRQETIPYVDESRTLQFITDGESNTYSLDFVPSTSDEIEVFAQGKRLRKGPLQVFDNTINQDSPEADVTVPAEYTIEGGTLTLETTLPEDVKLYTVRKIGKTWVNSGEQLRYARNSIADFLRETTTSLPK